jgi:hypothetical protein
MTPGSTQRDPRNIITPDAFEVSQDLLGTPLAVPSKRLIALLNDLMVVGLFTLVTRDFAMVLGVVAAIFFIRAGFKRTPVKGSVFGRAMRLSVGCLGIFIGLVTTLVWAAFGFNIGFGDDGDDDQDPTPLITSISGIPFAGVFAGLVTEAMFANVDNLQEAEAAVGELIEVAEGIGAEPEEILGLVLAAVPDDVSWADEAETAFTRLIMEDESERPASRIGLADDEIASIRDEVAAYSTAEALDVYSSLLDTELEDGAPAFRFTALADRLAGDIAPRTIAELEARIEDAEDEKARTESQLDSTREQLGNQADRSIFGTLRGFVDELSFGFGWWTLYLTVFLSWWKGQTVGKRLMGIRVVRLDGEPITWWVAFERVGGYAAGFATGLLGFAQVFWDANRQGIHDRIVGTVVIVDGADKVADWESAL